MNNPPTSSLHTEPAAGACAVPSDRQPRQGGQFLPYVSTVIGSAMLLGWTQQLWRADLRIPFHMEGDGWFYAMLVRSLMDNNWIWENSFLGAPGRMELYDFPVPDAFHLFMLKILASLSGDYAIALNTYYLLSFPLTAVLSLVVFRHFGLSTELAVVASLIYAFLPFHLLRGERHLFLSCYYQVPLMAMLTLRLFLSDGVARASLSRLVLHVLICILVGATGVYYAFFGCYFLVIAGLRSAIVTRAFAPLVMMVLFVGTISLTVMAILTPAVLYRHREGPNLLVATRTSGEPELYGLKIVQMVLPVDGHRVPQFAKVRANYNHHAQHVGENSHAALGVFGCLGLLALLSNLFFDWPTSYNSRLFRALALLTVSGVLLATIGGGSSLVALVVTSSIRSYNRIVVYLGLFCIFASALCIESVVTRFRSSFKSARGMLFLLAVTVLAGFDQTTRHWMPQYEANAARHHADAAFVRQIERMVPEGTMIFQLPHRSFPETPPSHRLDDYEPFRGYIHSRTLRWSYGAMKGRKTDQWNTFVGGLPGRSMVRALRKAGVGGIYIDRWGYANSRAVVESDLTSILGSPLTSQDGRLLFYALPPDGGK